MLFQTKVSSKDGFRAPSIGGIRLFLVLMLIVLFASGCIKHESGPESENISTSTFKDELMIAVGSEPDEGFDPIAGWGQYGSPLFQSTLLKRDNNLDIVSDLATDYAVSEDGLVWTIQLREGVQFSDGKPLTSEDVKFTFETAAVSGSTVDLTNVSTVEAPDEQTIVFTLKSVQSTFVHHLATIGIVPKHAYGERYAQQPIGSGPYQLVQWDKGQQLIVEENELYYGTKPSIKRIVFLFLNEDAAYAAARANQVDVAYIPAAFSKNVPAGMRLESLRTVDNRGIMFPVVASGEKTEAGVPIGNDVTADSAIRQAINIALQRQALVEGVLEGYGTPAYTSVDGLPWWNPDSVIQDGNMDEARQLLAASGWVDHDEDGVLEKGSLQATFSLIYPSSDTTRQALAIVVADMLKPLGIYIQAEGKSWDELRTLMHSNAVLFGWGSHDPLEMYHLYSSKYRGVGSFNPGYYSNPVVDDYMERAMAETDVERANEWWKKAQWDGETGLSAAGDASWAWLVNIDHLYLVKEGLDIGKQRIHPHGHGWPITDNIEEWSWKSD